MTTSPIPTINPTEIQDILLQIEAIIFASDSPVTLAHLKQVFEQQYTTTQLKHFIQLLSAQQQRAVELVETAQGYRFQVKAHYRHLIAQYHPEQVIKLSPALLEVLAVIAYHQPVTRSEIEQIRGVSTNAQVLRTLFDWNWIKESGHREIAGRPALLVTTPHFLTAFGISHLSQLPPLAETSTFSQAFASAHASEVIN